MKKFMDWMEAHFIPVAAKIGAQRHLVAIRDGFVTIMPLIMAGAFAVLINNLGWEPYQNFMNSILPANWKDFGGAIWNVSFGFMSILVVCTISFHLAKSYDKDGVTAAVVSLASFMMLYPQVALGGDAGSAYSTDAMGAKGLFVAIIVALIATEIFVKLIGNPKLVVNMPDGVPPAVARSFAALIPSILVLIIAAAAKFILQAVGISNVFDSVYNAIQSPLQGVVGSFWGMIVLILIQQLLWFFGLHGSNILAPVINAVLLPLLEMNMLAAKSGQAAQYIFNSQFLDSYVNLGGSGTTIALIIAIYIAGRRSKQQMMITKLSTAPGLFNINEPMIYGMPLVLNPIYFVPFVLAPLASASIAYFLTSIGFVPKVAYMATWTTPPIIGAAISTNSIMGAVTALICLVVSICIYLPFVIMATKQELDSEGV
ncbi:PTS sugar transporter subunit IIC [Clostridium baratii]|uniref:PTS sugar transporter subunit IIC n=1 Tax=Clostridium baratii TaxID=1561 RepID=UPI001C029EEF|nr:PTS sugar transporter subunit IIC [Clostridium baratii]MBT9832280.1 PTS lactose transporter subunit IIC [Clostridium baratii]